MQLKILKSKLHQATVTGSALHYHGSVTVDAELLEAVGLRPFEAVLVSNLATGDRGETYVLPGARGSGQVELNGAMARLGAVGDRIIVMSFAWLGPTEVDAHRPLVVALDARNRIVERFDYDPNRQAQ